MGKSDAIHERIGRNPVTDRNYKLPAEMGYEEWYEKYVANNKVALGNETAIKHRKSDEVQYEQYVVALGRKNMPETLAEFQRMKYNDTNTYETIRRYRYAVESGDLSALVSFSDYLDMRKKLDRDLLGIITSNGITIKGYSNHFVDRVFGSVEQKRNGVSVAEIIEALLRPKILGDIIEDNNGASQKFVSDAALISLNPHTGNLIQCNPKHRKGKI